MNTFKQNVFKMFKFSVVIFLTVGGMSYQFYGF